MQYGFWNSQNLIKPLRVLGEMGRWHDGTMARLRIVCRRCGRCRGKARADLFPGPVGRQAGCTTARPHDSTTQPGRCRYCRCCRCYRCSAAAGAGDEARGHDGLGRCLRCCWGGQVDHATMLHRALDSSGAAIVVISGAALGPGESWIHIPSAM